VIGDILAGIFGEVVFGRLSRSRRFQLLARLFFGFLMAGLGLSGAIWLAYEEDTGNIIVHASGVALFVFVACFGLFNVALARRWRWPGMCVVLSLIAMFASRIVLGP
jgi:predicted acyltransferase